MIRDDRSVAPGAAKAVALPVCLAVRGTPQTRQHLADPLWPDSLPDVARKNLRNARWVTICCPIPSPIAWRFSMRSGWTSMPLRPQSTGRHNLRWTGDAG